MIGMPSTFEVIFSPIREFCGLNRDSLSFPAAVLPKGMPLNEVPIPLPTLVDRQTDVRSMNPRGVKSASPIRNESGELWFVVGALTAACGLFTAFPIGTGDVEAINGGACACEEDESPVATRSSSFC